MSVLDRAFTQQVRYVTPGVTGGLAASLGRQIARDMGGLLPPFAAHLPAPEVLSACWAISREPSVGASVARATKEAVAAAVSAANACPYCVDVHTATMYALNRTGDGAAVESGRDDHIADPRLRSIVRWARATRLPGSPILADPPFSDAEAAEVIGTALAYHYINRMVSIFLVDSPFPRRSGPSVRRVSKRLLAPVVRRLMLRSANPGESLEFLPEVEHRAAFDWAKSDPVISAAFSASAAVFEEAGRRSLPEPVRRLVQARLRDWAGQHPPLSRGWVDEALAELPVSLRPPGRLALLAALAPYQVDERVVEEFLIAGSSEEQTLIAATGWASFAAMLRVNEWISPARLAA